MPDFLFTDPEGRKYYASGDDVGGAFAQAVPIGAESVEMLQRGMAESSPTAQMGREMERGAEITRETREKFPERLIDIAGQSAEMAIPGLGPAVTALRGNYGEAAGEAALQAVPFAGRLPKSVLKSAAGMGAAALGFAGGATAGEDFGFIEDPSERAASVAEYNSIKGYDKDGSYSRAETARLKREFLSTKQKEATQRGEVRQERIRQSSKEKDALQQFQRQNAGIISSLSDAQKSQLESRSVPGDVLATLGKQNQYIGWISSLRDFEERNKKAIDSLDDTQKQQFYAIVNPTDPLAEIQTKSDYLTKIGAEKERFTKTFSELHPELMEDIQKVSYVASAAVPMGVLAHRAWATRQAAKRAEEAYLAATKRSTKATEGDLALRANQLEDVKALSPWVYGGTALASPLLPIAAAEAPNLIDLGTLQSHQESPAYKKAWEAVNPWANPDVPAYESPAAKLMVRAGEEGLQATGVGFALGEPAARFLGGTRGASGTLKTIREREAKAATEKARKEGFETAESQGQSQERLTEANRLKADYAEKRQQAEQAEKELRAAIETAQKGRRKKNPLVQADPALSPGGAAPDVLSQGGGSQPLEREVLERGRSGRPVSTATLPQKDEDILQAGFSKNAVEAYHGSPHDFDRFDLSKIGTGEGAQAYGHGLYFAENEGVARSYRDALAASPGGSPTVLVGADKRPLDVLDAPGELFNLRGARSDVSHEELMKAAQDNLTWASSGKNPQLRAANVKRAQAAIDWLNQNEGAHFTANPETGRMYQVSIKGNPEHFLDWDRPLSEQSEHVQNAIEKVFPGAVNAELTRARNALEKVEKLPLSEYYNQNQKNAQIAAIKRGIDKLENDEGLTGKQLLDRLFMQSPSATQGSVAKSLHEAGIPGIRYLDQSSRSAGEGTRNYVVFGDKTIDILKKYGLLGPLGLGGAAAAGGKDPSSE